MTKTICTNLGHLIVKSLHIKFEFNWPALAERSKVNIDLWNLFLAIVTLDKTYQVRIMTLASIVFKKSTFQNFSQLNALGSKFDLDVKEVKVNPGSLFEQTWLAPKPNATYQVQRSSAFWFWKRGFLKGFYHICAWRSSWSCDQKYLNKLSFPHPKESAYEI